MRCTAFEWKRMKKNISKKACFYFYQSGLIWSLKPTLHDEQSKSETSFGVYSKGWDVQNRQSDLIKKNVYATTKEIMSTKEKK